MEFIFDLHYTDKNGNYVNLTFSETFMYSTVPQMLFEKAMDIPTTPIQYSKDSVGKFQPVNYIDFAQLWSARVRWPE